MSVRQLSVFAENKNGTIYEITKLLADGGINIRAFSVAETASFGVLRLIVDDPRQAAAVLSAADKIVSVTDVVAAAIPDRQGGLSELLSVLLGANITIDYLYAFVKNVTGGACVVLRVADNEAVEKILADAGFVILTEEEIRE